MELEKKKQKVKIILCEIVEYKCENSATEIIKNRNSKDKEIVNGKIRRIRRMISCKKVVCN